jgi:hypothetical protein
MPWADIPVFNLTMLFTALAAVFLAGVLLAIEFWASRRVSRQAPGAIVLLLLAVALVGCCLPPARAIAMGCGVLALIVLAAWTSSFEAARRQFARLATPKFVWGGVLLASMVASRYLAAHVLLSLDRQETPRELDLEDVPIRLTQAVTDAGQVVGLFHFKMHSSATQIEQFIASNEKDLKQIIRLVEPNSASNCHGWVFTGGKYGVRDPEVARILADNGYVEVANPREGDLAIYTSGEKFTHSGIVRIADSHTPVLVESKWGPFGVYLHGVNQQPFPGECRFFRSTRSGHQLTLRRTSDEPGLALDVSDSRVTRKEGLNLREAR